jgi:hypothetical protein
MKYSVLILFCLVFIFGCNNHITNTIQKNTTIVYSDSTTAAARISTDNKEHFFDKINAIDMCIQMKTNYDIALPQSQMVSDYKDYLQNDVRGFTTSEKKLVQNALNNIKTNVKKFHLDLFPDSLFLLVTKGKHYGNGVYYTREKCIIIPQNELNEKNKVSLEYTLVHELAHIYTRYHEVQKDKLYTLIGFEKLDPKKLRAIFKPISDKLLLNPDGVQLNYAMNVNDKGKLIKIMPLIFSLKTSYDPKLEYFFNYLNTNNCKMYPTEGGWQFQTNLLETLSEDLEKQFYDKITENTDYIIHPDEITADNIMILYKRKIDPNAYPQLKENGIALLNNFEKILSTN